MGGAPADALDRAGCPTRRRTWRFDLGQGWSVAPAYRYMRTGNLFTFRPEFTNK
jgi:hypothetical protein